MEIAQDEILRYLGYRNQNPDPATAKLIAECLSELKAVIRAGVVYQRYPLEKQGDRIGLSGTNLTIYSKDLSHHLRQADQCLLLAATLGLGPDQRIATYARLDLARGIVLDACATAAIEALCAEAQNKLKAKLAKEGYALTGRYSPGYGDLAITLQKAILEVLRAYPRIGLTVNEEHILLPRKSVTAFIGLEKREESGRAQERPAPAAGVKADDHCRRCPDQTCRYRKGGDRNG
ncbi:MAG: Vitamin B12 dependent methionine synthase activation protein [Firmicutes bacterium]|nr:Vitamin B12 dependent methionine synthase activation protein [Bacillota bacterium]